MTMIDKVTGPATGQVSASEAGFRPFGGFFGAVGRAIGAALDAHDAWEAKVNAVVYPDGRPEVDVVEPPRVAPQNGYDWMRDKLQAEYNIHGRCSFGSGRVLTDREMTQYGIRR